VGTITEIHDYLRLLYARVGTPYCPTHKLALQAQSRFRRWSTHVLALPADTAIMISAPIVASRKGEQHELVAEPARPGLRSPAHRRQSPRHRRGAQALEEREAHGRRGRRRLKVRPDAKQRLAESFETRCAPPTAARACARIESGHEHLFSGALRPARRATIPWPSSSRACLVQ